MWKTTAPMGLANTSVFIIAADPGAWAASEVDQTQMNVRW